MSAFAESGQEIPCKICRRPTWMLGTQMCDFCFNMDSCLNRNNAGYALRKAQALLEMPVQFTRYELEALAASPQALQAAIDYNDYQETCADGMDMPDAAKYHETRRKELTALRDAAAAKLQQQQE